MAFPPNYSQERRNRERAKQTKAQEKQAKREAESQQRKVAAETPPAGQQPSVDGKDKD